MSLLHFLSETYNTDKKMADHNYVMMYEKLMERSRLLTKKVLEVGFGAGGSIRMWMDYFTNAEIHCIEFKDEEYKDVWKNPVLEIPKMKLTIGDSTKVETWENLPNDFDYIIDDGSHFPEHQIATFMCGFSHLKSGGLYFIEDTHCGFEEKYGGKPTVYQWMFDYIIAQQTPGKSYGGNFYQSRVAMPDIVKDIYSYSFYKSVIVLEKA